MPWSQPADENNSADDKRDTGHNPAPLVRNTQQAGQVTLKAA